MKKGARGMAFQLAQSDFSRHLADGMLLEEAMFQQQAGMTRAELEDAVRHGRVLRIEGAEAGHAYPALHVDRTLNQTEVQAVLRLLQAFPPKAQWLFMTTPKGTLATPAGQVRTPVEALRDGDFPHVLRTALRFTEM